MEETRSSVSALTTIVNRILECSEDVSRRLATIETEKSSLKQAGASIKSSFGENDEDDASTILPPRTFVPDEGVKQTSVSTSQFDFLLESALHESRVYARLTHRHSASSFPLDAGSLTGMSFLSGISLAQVSNISVISLPIFHYEVLNPQNYTIKYEGSNKADNKTSKLDSAVRPLASFKFDVPMVAMEQTNNAKSPIATSGSQTPNLIHDAAEDLSINAILARAGHGRVDVRENRDTIALLLFGNEKHLWSRLMY